MPLLPLGQHLGVVPASLVPGYTHSPSNFTSDSALSKITCTCINLLIHGFQVLKVLKYGHTGELGICSVSNIRRVYTTENSRNKRGSANARGFTIPADATLHIYNVIKFARCPEEFQL